MSARSLNKVILIGNLTRDPELRYTPAGTAVCTFGLATNRSWTTQTGETKEETEFHRIVAWNKLGELCAQLLAKGRKTYVEGRLSTHSWTGQDGTQRMTTEVVIEDMIILDSKRLLREGESAGTVAKPTVKVAAEPVKVPEVDVKADVVPQGENTSQDKPKEKKAVAQAPSGKKPTDKKKEEKEEEKPMTEDITPDDIPF